MGMCDQGPAMLVNDQVYTELTPDKIHAIVNEYRVKAEQSGTQRAPERVR
jgi:NADH:ubiquinone oxidoreductase subunit E